MEMDTPKSARHLMIVDDHPLFRDALAMAVRTAAPDCDLVFADAIEDAVRQAGTAPPELVLLDLNLKDSKGLDSLVNLQAQLANAPIAIVSATDNPETVSRAKGLGAIGYIPKSASLDELQAAVTALLSGKTWYPLGEANDGETSSGSDMALRLGSLTPAQRRVLAGLRSGLLNKQIAYEMGISEATVKAHMTAIFRKLGVNNRTQALLMLQSVTND